MSLLNQQVDRVWQHKPVDGHGSGECPIENVQNRLNLGPHELRLWLDQSIRYQANACVRCCRERTEFKINDITLKFSNYSV